MKVRYDIRCPHRNCWEPIVEIMAGIESKGFVCKKHGPVTPGITTEQETMKKEAEK